MTTRGGRTRQGVVVLARHGEGVAMEGSAEAMTPGSAGPRGAYEGRLAWYRTCLAAIDRRLAWFGYGRVALFLLILAVAWLAWSNRSVSFRWTLVPVATFVIVSWFFERAFRRRATALRAIEHYERGLDRLQDHWAGRGASGAEYAQESHLFAADLDLFGPGSLFERLCEARARIGRDTLAGWLAQPATQEVISQRQQAVQELAPQLEWRERFILLGDDVPAGIRTDVLSGWGETMPDPGLDVARRIAPVFVAMTLTTLAGWSAGVWGGRWFLGALLLQIVFAQTQRRRVKRALAELAGRSRDLLHLTGILKYIERGHFSSPLLVAMQQSLLSEGVAPSKRLAQLARRTDLLDSTRNLFFAALAPFLLWTTQVTLALEAWRRRTGPALRRWTNVIGEMEALNSLASYSYENPQDPFPEIVAGSPLYEATGLGHPLLPRASCVTNDVRLDDHARLLVVSGSNMSGKSTFLRTVGINAVLAMAGAPVRAATLKLTPLAIGATLRIQDSLLAGKSRFYAEITRLRQIVELAKGPIPLLFLLDEILHGTNSHDRRIGAEGIFRSLLSRPAIGLVTTHDLALTQITDRLAPRAVNVHFADELVDGELHFDFRMRHGIVDHSNALALMRAVGLDVGEEKDE